MTTMLESQTRFGGASGSMLESIFSAQSDIATGLRMLVQQNGKSPVPNAVLDMAARCERLNHSLTQLLQKGRQPDSQNSENLRRLLSDLNTTFKSVSESLIEKDLLEKHGAILERILLMLENSSKARYRSPCRN